MRFLEGWRGRKRGYTNLAPLCRPTPAPLGPEVERPLNPAMHAASPPNHNDLRGKGDDSPRSGTSVGTVDGLSACCQVKETWTSDPQPPPQLWDTDDVQYLDKVKCHAWVRLTHVDPKNGSYEGRMEVHWSLRTLNTKDRTEPRVRVPGIRLPRLVCSVEESRIWRHFDGDSERTIAWQGTSVISFLGYEIFEVHDFPFDRQIVTLDLFEFVWRTDKDSDIYHEAMKIVSFTLETISMLPEWDTFPAIIEPCDIKRPGSGPIFGSRFIVKLRLQRKERYYVVHIFLVSLLILGATLLPLSIVPGHEHVGDRLAIHSAGLLTLVAFKYGVSHDLPSVPYATFISTFLTLQICTLVFVCGEAVFAYKVVHMFINVDVMHKFEDGLLTVLLVGWVGFFLHIAFNKKRVSWEQVLSNQDDYSDETQRYEPPST